MPAEEIDNPFVATEGLPTAPGQFVIRYRGLLVRGDKALPVLFPTMAAANAEAEALWKAAVDGV